MSYKLGVIGGMGPLATEIFYKYIIDNTPANSDQEHIDMVILSHATIPDRTTEILNGLNNYIEVVKKDFDILNNIGVCAIAIPCNTSHYFYERMCEFTNIPIINMVEETIKRCKEEGYKKVSVLGTYGTVNSKVYDKYAQKHDIEIVTLDDEEKKDIMEIIYWVKATNKRRSERFLEIVDKYSQNSKVILACTELSVLDLDDREVVDALKVLGDESIKRCGYGI